MAPPKLRALQPSPLPTASSTSPGNQPLPGPVRKAGYVPACEPCRKRKKKVRDTDCLPRLCGPGQLEKLASYLNSEPVFIVDLLTTLPYFEALELFNMLREMPRGKETSETQIPSIPLAPLQPQNLNKSLLPSNPMIQELTVRHPIAYPVLLPMAVSDLPLEELTSRRPGMTATQVLRDTGSPSSADMILDDDEEAEDDALFEFCSGLPHLTQSYVEYLQKVDLTLWMELPIPNETAVRVIALYLNNDYPVLPFFHADLFLQDLCHKRPYFCSALLISALLGWACLRQQACTCIDPETASWSPLLFADAQKRWSQLNPDESITITSLSALQFMCMTAITHGQDDLGLDYLRQVLKLGQKMGILNAEPGAQAGWLTGYPDWIRASSYAAWGAYNLASIVSLHFHMVHVHTAPELPMPGGFEDDSRIQDGKLHVSRVNGQVFRASCKLWVIFATIVKRYYGQSDASDQTPSVEFAEKIYRQLLGWADELPLELVRQPGSCHGVHMLHIYLHAIITDLFRPLLQGEFSSAPLRTFEADNATPQTVYHASIGQMKRLLLSHRSDMGPEVLSIFWQSCVIYVANAVIHGGEDQQERQFYVKLGLTGLQELYLSYRVSGKVVKAIAAMAIRNGVLDKDQAVDVRRRLEETAGRFEMDSQAVGKWVIDLDLAVTDFAGAQVGKLAEDFDSIGGVLKVIN
ncbi:uncharacterized protein FIESC28_10832 [Fusarium coffeatum]|uniref:Transcription factor domain-containing protein n=1 Tax=Fusarium coffeatum TaxID=231269 RepID=A0A366QSH4_9HYPO|nr:uncharacterized protein FIESC28_10832 [Fusarium coffeatum]RBR07086.1 hypothetical protein FIESC28_10832 [Fusarium coffeatum]